MYVSSLFFLSGSRVGEILPQVFRGIWLSVQFLVETGGHFMLCSWRLLNNVLRENLSVPDWKWWTRAICINGCLLIMLFFLTTPIMFLHTLDLLNIDIKKTGETLHVRAKNEPCGMKLRLNLPQRACGLAQGFVCMFCVRVCVCVCVCACVCVYVCVNADWILPVKADAVHCICWSTVR